MAVQTIEAALREHPFLEGFSPEQLAVLASCAQECRLPAGEYLWRQGEQADVFYLIESGQVALEILVPHQGPLRIDTIRAGEALGWSWLVPAYRWHFDARALAPVQALRFDGKRLRERCEQDPALGYRLLRQFAPVIARRLTAARLRLLDLYGASGTKRPVPPDGNGSLDD